MIKITDKKDCTGCHACASVCPVGCITMKADAEGFLYPRVETERCISCRRCERVCPVLHPCISHLPIGVYASKAADEDVRKQSSSGGIFTLLAEEVIRRGGVVFGARFDASWKVVHAFAETREELSALRGTKYVQSVIGDTYAQTRSFLEQGRWVLFTGTPCQVAGLKHFLRRHSEKLLTAEVVCHGVPSPEVWRTYLDEILPVGERIAYVDMRDKSTGWNTYGMRIASDKRMLYEGKAGHNVFSRGFLADFYLRPSCHACPAKQGRSGADLTLGDFWGIGEVCSSMNDDRGVSLVCVHTDIGMNFYRLLDVISHEVTYEQVLRLNPAIVRSAQLSPLREEFWRRFPREGMKTVRGLWWKKRVKRYSGRLIQNVVKNLKSVSWCKQILRDAQDKTADESSEYTNNKKT